MFGTQHLTLFMISGLLLNLTPGQDTLYIVGRSVSQGRRAGFLSVLGIVSGCVIHTHCRRIWFVCSAGDLRPCVHCREDRRCVYLGYLGIRMMLERVEASSDAADFAHESDWAIFRAGLLTNVLNPKVALFFMAFLPQFVAPDAHSRIASFLFLGAVFIFNGTLWCFVLVWCASAMSRRLRQRGPSGLILKRATGALFVGLGLRLAVSK